MFPFLSVLCSVIGVLILLILLIVGTRAIEAEQIIRASGSASQAYSTMSGQERAALQAEVKRLAEQLVQGREELDALRQMRDTIQELLALKRDQLRLQAGDRLTTSADIGPEEFVEMVPVGNLQTDKKAVFIEVSLDGYMVRPDGVRYPISDLPALSEPLDPESGPATGMQEYFRRMDERREKISLVFLIHQDGVKSFDRVQRYLVRKYPHPDFYGLSRIDMGWEPFSGLWVLDNRGSDATRRGNAP